jgi:regulator of protease activity HflC (stomatin/prohibitin superfamily)
LPFSWENTNIQYEKSTLAEHKEQWNSMGITVAIVIILVVAVNIFLAGIRVVRPTERGLVETLGKYSKFALPGYHWVIPGIIKLNQINITEQMINAEPQVIITNDNLNTTVDAQVYFKVRDDEQGRES